MSSVILSVEDNTDLLFNIKLILELNGYQVITASNGREALELLTGLESPPDLILSDIMMPEMDGYDFYISVSKDSRWNTIPFIFLSAKSTIEDIRLAKQMGVDDYIIKPFQEQDLLASIEGKLSKANRNKQLQEQLEQKIKEDSKINALSDLNQEVEKLSSNPNLDVIFYTNWDDIFGPRLEDYYPKDKKIPFSVNELVMQLFSISESLYGLYGEIQPQGILINIVNINRMGYLYFDSTFNAKMRGGSQLFMLGVISPNIHYLASLRIQEILKDIAEKIKTSQDYQFEEYSKTLEQILAIEDPQFREIWIFGQNGIEMVSYAPETDMNPDLFSGFLSAIQDFTIELSKNELKMFQAGNSQYYIYREADYPFYIVAKINPIATELNLKKIMKNLFYEFWNQYSEELEKFIGNTTPFKKFKKNLKKYIK